MLVCSLDGWGKYIEPLSDHRHRRQEGRDLTHLFAEIHEALVGERGHPCVALPR